MLKYAYKVCAYGDSAVLELYSSPGGEGPFDVQTLFDKQGVSSAHPYTGTDLYEGKSPILAGNVTTYTVTGLDPNKIYHFSLTACNEYGERGYSSVVTVNPTPTTTKISCNKLSI